MLWFAKEDMLDKKALNFQRDDWVGHYTSEVNAIRTMEGKGFAKHWSSHV